MYNASCVCPDQVLLSALGFGPIHVNHVRLDEGYRCISLGDIHNLPTFWVLALFGTFYNFCFCVQTCRHLGGGGMCILFEICKKTPFQKCMGLGGRG